MILKKIDLHNYRQHHDLTVDFSGNLITVVGTNGSGKSNFLGAIQFALTGEQPGFSKEDLLSWGEESGYVELDFLHNGKDCKIQRRIEKPAVTLYVDDEKTTGASKVKEALELLGVDKDVLRQSVFVRQTEIESCLFTDPRERELAFQKLIGLGDASKHNKFLTDFLAAVEKPKDMTDDIAKNVEAMEQQIKTQAELRAKSEVLAKKLADLGDAEQTASNKVAIVQKRMLLIQELQKKTEDHATAEQVLYEFVASHASELVEKPVPVADLRKREEELNATLIAYTEAETVNSSIQRLENDIKSYQATINNLSGLPERIQEYEDKNTEFIETTARIRELKKLVAVALDDNICPLCGSTADHNIKDELAQEIENLEQHSEVLRTWLISNFVDEDKNRLAEANAGLASSMEALKQCGPKREVGDRNAVQVELRNVQSQMQTAISRNQQLQYVKMTYEQYVATEAATAKQLEDIKAKLPSSILSYLDKLDVVVEKMNQEIQEIFTQLQSINETKTQKATLDGGIAQIDKAIEENKKQIAYLKQLQQDNLIKAEKLKIVSDVKDWFAYRNGPRVMTQAIMTLLTEETNKFLTKFGSAFNVIPMNEGMGFRCVFNDGREMPSPPPEASMLSGGQKIALAVAFRFAVYSMFAGKLGLLSLDEPTAYLDNETISRFGDMLGQIKDLAKNLNLQVLLATHEESILGNADQTIVIGR